jgi:hypothetical protein
MDPIHCCKQKLEELVVVMAIYTTLTDVRSSPGLRSRGQQHLLGCCRLSVLLPASDIVAAQIDDMQIQSAHQGC